MIFRYYLIFILLLASISTHAKESIAPEVQDQLDKLQQAEEQENEARQEYQQLVAQKRAIKKIASIADRFQSQSIALVEDINQLSDKLQRSLSDFPSLISQDIEKGETLMNWFQESIDSFISAGTPDDVSVKLDNEYDSLLVTNQVCSSPGTSQKAIDSIEDVAKLKDRILAFQGNIDLIASYSELSEHYHSGKQSLMSIFSSYDNLAGSVGTVMGPYVEKLPDFCSIFLSFKKIKSFIKIQSTINGNLDTLRKIDLADLLVEIETVEKANDFIKKQRRAILDIGYQMAVVDQQGDVSKLVRFYQDSLSVIDTISMKVESVDKISNSQLIEFRNAVKDIRKDMGQIVMAYQSNDKAYRLVNRKFRSLSIKIRRLAKNQQFTKSKAWQKIVSFAKAKLDIDTQFRSKLPKDQSLNTYSDYDLAINQINNLIGDN